MALFTAAPKHLCVLRLSAIGDVCHAISVVQAIQQHWPNTKITWIVGKVEAQLIHDLPDINVVIFDKKQGLKGMRAVWAQLKHIRFDALLHMQAALRASLLSLGINARYRVGFSRNRTREGQFLFTNRHLPNTDAFHVLDNFAEFARYIGAPMDKPRWHIPLSEQDYAFAKQAITERTLVICPAASKDERNWLVERYAAVADYAVSLGMEVALCGSPSERERNLGEAIERSAKAKITNLIGQTSLKQLTAVLARAQVVLAPDSGPAHIATTQATPVIGLYAHSNPKRTGPYNSQSYVVSNYQAAIKQQDKAESWGARAKGDTLMEGISVQSVIETLDTVLKSQQKVSNG